MDELSSSQLGDVMKWWFNLIHLDLYYLLIIVIKLVEENEEEFNLSEEEYLDAKILSGEIRNSFESFMKIGLKRSGISISQNTYTGFNSEYQYKGDKFNTLISVQLAVSSRIILKLPTPVNKYKLFGVNSFTGDIYKLSIGKVHLFNGHIFSRIDERIKFLRNILYPGYDYSMRKLLENLKTRDGLTFVEKGEFTYFYLDKGLLRT